MSQYDGSTSSSWEDYTPRKRNLIDKVLNNVDENVAESIRRAIIEAEKTGAQQKFKSFVLSSLTDSYFRSDAKDALRPISRDDLSYALGIAYGFRSKFVHELVELPNHIGIGHDYSEIEGHEGNAVLSFQGIARLSRHVIKQFLVSAPTLQTENFNYRAILPGIVMMRMAPQYWIHESDGLNQKSSRNYLNGLVAHYHALQSDQNKRGVPNLTDICEKIELLLPSYSKQSDRLPLLAIYNIYNATIEPSLKRKKWDDFLISFGSDLVEPSIESLCIHLTLGRTPEWSVSEIVDVQAKYRKQRTHKQAIKLPPMYEAALAVIVAMKAGDVNQPELVISSIQNAIEALPGFESLLEIERRLLSENGEVDLSWQSIFLLPREETPSITSKHQDI